MKHMTPQLGVALETVADAALRFAESENSNVTPMAILSHIEHILTYTGKPKRRVDREGNIHLFPWERPLDVSPWEASVG